MYVLMASVFSIMLFITLFLVYIFSLKFRKWGLTLGLLITIALFMIALRLLASIFEMIAVLLVFLILYFLAFFSMKH